MSFPSRPVDSIAASISENRLSDVLTLVHREGFGHNAQVVHPERGKPIDRLRRAGLEQSAAIRLAEQNRPIVLLFAPERVESAELILRKGGASVIERYAQYSGTQSALIGFDPTSLHSSRTTRRGGAASGS